MPSAHHRPNIGIGSELTCEGRRFNVCEVLFHSGTGDTYLVAISSRKKRFGADVYFGDARVGTIINDGPEVSGEVDISPRTWEPFTIIRVVPETAENVKTTGETIVRANGADLVALRALWQVVHLAERGLEGRGAGPTWGRISTASLPLRVDGWLDCDGLEFDAFEVELEPATTDVYFRPGQYAMAEGWVIGYSLAKFTEDNRHYVVCVSPLTENDLAGPWKFKSETDAVMSRQPESESEIGFEADTIIDAVLEDLVTESSLGAVELLLRQQAEEQVA
ncbi:hypothetical protein EU803_15380 [Loktanella sp. IMCC34160]|uniref:hypothetical protein n=1 Tax=Loktanella sp. IMCC34160 TaxID=2510646 RepID=UPI00101DB792|nr:hypothetical protein [Loktanella sp. IMCC34160]RYG89997.1 hypothetical protein EU803_15380 [Loktanella sp. IMCC34160]